MSSLSSINTLINDIGLFGLQSGARYTVVLGDFLIPSSYILSVDLPGPKYDLLNINYWEGNQFARVPIGLRFEDPVVLNVLLPLGSIFEQSFVNYMANKIYTPNSGPYFGNGANVSNFFGHVKGTKGIGIQVNMQDANDAYVRSFTYVNCFLEKILPLKMAADTPPPSYITMTFAVGGMA